MESGASATERTRSLLERPFLEYERGDAEPLFEHVADDVHWTVMGTHPLAGEHRSREEFRQATYERLDPVLEAPSVTAYVDSALVAELFASIDPG